MRIGPFLFLEKKRRRDGSTFAFLLLALHYRTAMVPRMDLTWQRSPRAMSFSAGGWHTSDDGSGRCVGLWLRLPLLGHLRFMLSPRLGLNSPRSAGT